MIKFKIQYIYKNDDVFIKTALIVANSENAAKTQLIEDRGSLIIVNCFKVEV